jgi:alpha-glucosidase
MQLDVDQGDVDYYVFFGPDPADVVELFTDLVGRMPLPPRWALGYHQSRWGYSTADAVRHVASELRRRRLPSDAIHLDIDHMDGFRTFTWHPERFPDPAGLIGELGQVGFKAVCIVNAGVKYEPDGDYAVYREGHERGMFLRRSLEPGSEEHLGYVWPGLCAFPDHVREDVRGWWGAQYLGDLEIGVAGFLNDMNEPAMHDLPVDAHGSDNTEPPGDLLHGTQEEPVTHAEARNVYAHLENRAAYECLRRARPDERPFLLTRSGYAGVQRFAGVWTGDPTSTWEHLEMSLAQILNLGLSGMAFAGADIGGFFESSSPELLVRWMQLGALTPLARNHSAKDTAAQEPWAWGEEVESACRRALELRYRLMPHLYTLLEETSRTGVPILRPLFFHDPRDEVARRLSDEALLGRDLLLAPVLRPGVAERAVYLPAGAWTDMRTGRRHDGSSWLLSSARLAEEIPLFARSGSIVPMGPVLQWTDERPLDPLTLAVFPGDEEIAEGALYEDDGRSFAYERGESCTTSFRLARGRLVARRAGDFAPPPRRVLIVVHRDGEAIEHEIEQDADEWEADVR